MVDLGNILAALAATQDPCGAPVGTVAAEQHRWRDEVAFDRRLTDGAARLAYVLATHVHTGAIATMRGLAWPSQGLLAWETGFSIRQIRRLLDELGTLGYVRALRRRKATKAYRLTWPRERFERGERPFREPSDCPPEAVLEGTRLSGQETDGSVLEGTVVSPKTGHPWPVNGDTVVPLSLSKNPSIEFSLGESIEAPDRALASAVSVATASALLKPADAEPIEAPKDGFSRDDVPAADPEPAPPAKPSRSLAEISSAILTATPTRVRNRTDLARIREALKGVILSGAPAAELAEAVAEVVAAAQAAKDRRPAHEIVAAEIEAQRLARQTPSPDSPPLEGAEAA